MWYGPLVLICICGSICSFIHILEDTYSSSLISQFLFQSAILQNKNNIERKPKGNNNFEYLVRTNKAKDPEVHRKKLIKGEVLGTRYQVKDNIIVK